MNNVVSLGCRQPAAEILRLYLAIVLRDLRAHGSPLARLQLVPTGTGALAWRRVTFAKTKDSLWYLANTKLTRMRFVHGAPSDGAALERCRCAPSRRTRPSVVLLLRSAASDWRLAIQPEEGSGRASERRSISSTASVLMDPALLRRADGGARPRQVAPASLAGHRTK